MNAREFMNQYHRLGKRRESFELVISMSVERDVKRIVETGTARKKGNWRGDGLSTHIFGNYCNTFGGKLWTCDISPKNIQTCKEITQKYSHNITYIAKDSLAFLKKFDSNIGDGTEARKHSLKEIKLAEPKLHEDSIVFLDDFCSGRKTKGKCGLSVPYLKNQGWVSVYEGCQVVLIRG
jgi:predicted O-methyltransferase YrrM